jgi:hypothetical protein
MAVWSPLPNQCEVLISEDGGISWRNGAATDILWASPFVHDNQLYMIGNLRNSRDIVIARSDDGGESWTKERILFAGRYTNAPTTVLRKGRFIYRAFETATPGNSTWKSLCVAGDTERDLLDPAAWRISNHVPYPGTPSTFKQGDHPQGLYAPDLGDKIPEDGWLEGNMVEVRGQLGIILRVRMQAEATANVCALCSVVDDGTELSNQFVQFYPMPGGQCKFHIIHDDATGLYWTATTPPTDSFQPREPLLQRGFAGTPGNERRALALLYSLDALNWFMAGFVALAASPLEAFSYASLLIYHDDLLVLARTSKGGKNQHDTNFITLHRIEDFRELVPSAFLPQLSAENEMIH